MESAGAYYTLAGTSVVLSITSLVKLFQAGGNIQKAGGAPQTGKNFGVDHFVWHSNWEKREE